MDILSYLTLLAIFSIPTAIGFSTIWFLKGALRIWIIVAEWSVPAGWLAVYFSPLAQQFNLTHDPGYDSDTIRMAVCYVAALGFLILSAIGMGLAILMRHGQHREASRNKGV